MKSTIFQPQNQIQYLISTTTGILLVFRHSSNLVEPLEGLRLTLSEVERSTYLPILDSGYVFQNIDPRSI